MTHVIPAGTPKARQAADFGRELVKALAARNVSLNELARVTGIGHTAIDHYRSGRTLPRTAPAQAIAETLRWPKLAEIVVAARTLTCARTCCARTFRNETGAARRRYCSVGCQQLAVKLRATATENRRAGQRGEWSSTDSAAVRQARAAVKIADERVLVLSDAIAAMCRGCEPEGLCQTADCPLRPHSPLPLATHEIGDARTIAQARAESWTPERSARQTELLNRRWADPEARRRQGEQTRERLADPEYRERHSEAVRAGIARRTPEDFARASRKAWAKRRSA